MQEAFLSQFIADEPETQEGQVTSLRCLVNDWMEEWYADLNSKVLKIHTQKGVKNRYTKDNTIYSNLS